MAHHTVAKLASGTKVEVVKQLGDWYVVRVPKSVPLYISAKWVRRESDESGVVAGDRVNLRATPSTKYGAMGVSYRGTVVKILGKTDGFLKIHCTRGSDTIVGATVAARHAGEMISEITTAMVAGIGLGTLSSVIHPYPTRAEAIRKAADAYNRTRLTPRVAAIMKRWFAWTR